MTKGKTNKAAPAAPKEEKLPPEGRDWSKTLFLGKTGFSMKAGLPKLEPQLLARWEKLGLYERLRKESEGRDKFVLHDGPPYANGNIHVGHALNKILKDVIIRSQQMLGKDAAYVPGWDCHGLPIEWKVEEQYRAKGKNKDDVPVLEFRHECREFARKWIDVQREEFKRLGIEGDWPNPYTTMNYPAEAVIAGELLKFAMNGSLYLGSRPVMWSVVERTTLAEAEIEYHDHTSPTIFVKFPVIRSLTGKLPAELEGASAVIWTTTPWTIPGNRAIAFSNNIDYGLYQVVAAPEDNWAKAGDLLVLSDALAESVIAAARIEEWRRIETVDPAGLVCRHPFHEHGYDFEVRLHPGDFVTEDTGTGFVHCAPGHGADDYLLYLANKKSFAEAGIDDVPHTVGEDGYYFAHVPLFGGAEPKRVINDQGKFDTANDAVIQALIDAGALLARGRLKHQYPHSWRSKKPVIFRNTPQWFVAIDKPIKVKGQKKARSIRELARSAIEETRFIPRQSVNRISAMVDQRPDWLLSRQRAWGVPITVFVHKATGEVLPNPEFKGSGELIKRIVSVFTEEGADAWFADGARERFLDGLVTDPGDWKQVTEILDVWFDSGCTHAFVMEDKRRGLKWPADLYLEGSDQHRGWFQSSLMESCGTRGRAPYDAVLTHGFLLDEKIGDKIAKSKGGLSPKVVAEKDGAEILRLWVASADYTNDIRFGPGIVQASAESYRKLRNTFRFLLGNLTHFKPELAVEPEAMPELERVMLHRLFELDGEVRKAYGDYDFKRVFRLLFEFCGSEVSAFYLDIRRDALYCEPYDSLRRRSCLTVIEHLFDHLTAWLAPILCFTMEEAWLARHPEETGSVHLRQFPETPTAWQDDALAGRWETLRQVRRVVTGALEVERREKRIGSSLEAAPEIYIDDKDLMALCADADWAEIAITSAASLLAGPAPAGAFHLDDVHGVGVVPKLAEGRKCARSWKISSDVGTDAEFPELSPRDAEAVRQFDAHFGETA
jgi:isoleucyl-tRNA synthetase